MDDELITFSVLFICIVVVSIYGGYFIGLYEGAAQHYQGVIICEEALNEVICKDNE